ncbi:ABC transporter ATP-binding protein [Stygiolobus caldivivus]|uniref:Multidrug ABC transporter ATP-binding protein n=1 Tax=Stygiolobus caldivivus TaxID=2824673 RepID=A0A8D5U867_9CREN|nr:ABC transporter ATP-binding protein [Stygiolobus caldivivus]BCU70747.1 multidrug ABC transporter ATP-binding protein [Stygiolobus caldivivus]
MECISVRDLVKRYGDTIALNGVSFKIMCGEKWALLGPNGAGKSTTLKILAGLIKPDAGEVKIKGDDPTSLSSKRRIGYLPEDADPFPALSVEDNLRFMMVLRGIKDEKRLEYLIEVLELDKFRKYKAAELSRGNKQKLAIAMTILHSPEILLLDEPLNYLDIPTQDLVIDLFQSLRDSTFIVSTHIMSVANKLTDKAMVLSNGALKWMGDFEELKGMGESIEKVVAKLIKGG